VAPAKGVWARAALGDHPTSGGQTSDWLCAELGRRRFARTAQQVGVGLSARGAGDRAGSLWSGYLRTRNRSQRRNRRARLRTAQGNEAVGRDFGCDAPVRSEFLGG